MLCQIVVGPHFQNFTLHCCFFTWRRASENVDRISNNSKKKIVFVFNIFKGFTWNKMCSLLRWKAKNEKKLKKKMVFLWPCQNSFAYFGLFSNFQQKYSFLRSVGFLKMKTLLRGRKSLQKNENRSTLLGRPLYSVPGVGGSRSFERMCGWGYTGEEGDSSQWSTGISPLRFI